MSGIFKPFCQLATATCLCLASFHGACAQDTKIPPKPSETSLDSVTSDTTGPDKSTTDQNQSQSVEYYPLTGIIKNKQLTLLPEDDNAIRLLEVSVGSIHFDDLVQAYQVDNTLFIPLGYFSSIIDLAISTDPAKAVAQGFIFQEQKTFYLDVNRGEVTLSGKRKKVDISRLAIRELDDIYVDSSLISEWFPMKLDIDLYAARIEIKPDAPLPIQLRRIREHRLKRARANIPKDRGYPTQVTPYQMWSYPYINLTARAGILRDSNGDLNPSRSYSAYATADLMRMESSWYLAGSKDKPFDQRRVTFGRKDPEATLLGPMRAREYSFGHINEPGFTLVNSPTSIQPGATISNYPLTRQLQFDSHNFHGDLPPGWQVELYRNNSLLNYQPEAVNGQYQFDDVPLLFGHNYFRLVFYGPQGQQREETVTFELNNSLTQSGEQYYRAFVTSDEHFGTRTIVQYDAGINKTLSATANFASIPIDDSKLITEQEKNHNYFDAGIRGFHNALFYSADYIKDMQSGAALKWNIQTQVSDYILRLGESYFIDEFISEQFPQAAQYIQRRTEARMDTAIPNSYFSRIPFTLELSRDQLSGNVVSNRITNRMSVTKHKLAASNTLSYISQSNLDNTLSGTLQVSQRMPVYNVRGTLGYLVNPDSKISSASITVDGFRLWGYYTSTGYSRIIMSKTDQVFFNLTQPVGEYSLGVNSTYSTGGVFNIELSFQMGIGREPRSGHWFTEHRPLANYGAMTVKTYLDENGNGSWDSGDKNLENVKLRLNGGEVPRKSNAEGIIYLVGLEPYRAVDVEIATDTLEDPLWQPAIEGKRVSLRPGYAAQIDFPIIITGEIDGTVYVQLNKGQREVSGVVVELVDIDGKVLQTTKTAYDGYYLFSKIPTGKYQIRVSRKQIDSLGLRPIKSRSAVIEAKEPIVSGRDFVLQKQ